MTWFRRSHEQAQQDVAPDASDTPDALRAKIFELIAFVNRSAGQLPGEGVVLTRHITDTVREVVDGADAERGLDIYAVVAIRGIVDDYLPTTLRSYLALDASVVEVPRPSGRTPSASLLEQLDVLWSSATDLLVATQAHDADSLLSQGNFLRTKFTRSDLDL
ncbi:MAG: hypothetical protein ABI429_09960 [Jatrophihabitantaceae bacterium]